MVTCSASSGLVFLLIRDAFCLVLPFFPTSRLPLLNPLIAFSRPIWFIQIWLGGSSSLFKIHCSVKSYKPKISFRPVLLRISLLSLGSFSKVSQICWHMVVSVLFAETFMLGHLIAVFFTTCSLPSTTTIDDLLLLDEPYLPPVRVSFWTRSKALISPYFLSVALPPPPVLSASPEEDRYVEFAQVFLPANSCHLPMVFPLRTHRCWSPCPHAAPYVTWRV